jgi:hypothetical protein
LNSHGRGGTGRYNDSVNRSHTFAMAIAALLLAFACSFARAFADTSQNMTFSTGSAPVVRVQMRSGIITIRTWNQQQIAISSNDPVFAQHFMPDAVERALGGGDIPIFATAVKTPEGILTLPPEAFPIAPIGPDHDGVLVRPGDDANLTLTVPVSTALVWVVVGRGQVHMRDYRSGSFVVRVHAGSARLQNVGGDGYVEVARGPVILTNSAFNRLRARSAVGDIIFENCNARQIEVSSINGSIAYDNGTFVPGLARFESQNGNVALGIAGGGVQIGAHTAAGRVFQFFGNGASVRGSETDKQVTAGGGGPIVTASTARGNIYLYKGTLRHSKQKLPHNGHI